MFTFVFNLNGGDSVTADSDLTFKIYDNAVLYHTTQSATNDANVSVTGGQVTIQNVPGTPGQSYDFSVTATDEAGNESTVSNVIQITANAGTLIYESDFATGITGFQAIGAAVFSNPNSRFRMTKESANADMGFALPNSNFIPPDNVNFVDGTEYRFEIDVHSLVRVNTANNNYPAPAQTELNIVAGQTYTWSRSDMSNGSFQITFGVPTTPWQTGDYVELSAVRVYKL